MPRARVRGTLGAMTDTMTGTVTADGVRPAVTELLAWMHANFTDHRRVAALGDADSYATRLFDYEHRVLDGTG